MSLFFFWEGESGDEPPLPPGNYLIDDNGDFIITDDGAYITID